MTNNAAELQESQKFVLVHGVEALEAEQLHDSLVISWTSRLTVGAVLDTLEAQAGKVPAEFAGTVVLSQANANGDFIGEGTSGDILKFVREGSADIETVNLRYPDFMFTWSTKAEDPEVVASSLGECSLRLFQNRPEFLRSYIGATASMWLPATPRWHYQNALRQALMYVLGIRPSNFKVGSSMRNRHLPPAVTFGSVACAG